MQKCEKSYGRETFVVGGNNKFDDPCDFEYYVRLLPEYDLHVKKRAKLAFVSMSCM